MHTAHGGKMSVARVLSGQVGDGTTFMTPEREAGRVAGVFKLIGQNTEKRGPAQAGETVALGKLDHANTGDTLTAGKQAHPPLVKVAPYPPVLAIAVAAKERKDDVKLGQALAKLLEEDPSISVVHNAEAHEVVLWGQGEMHLRVATERLADRFGVAIVDAASRPSAIARPSRRRSCSAAATRSSRAATASSATSCSTSSRCRAARASASRRRSRAAWCRATIFLRWRKASSTRSSTVRSASRWSTSRRS